MSPPGDSFEIRLDCEITSAKNNPEMKVNISEKKASGKQDKIPFKLTKISESEVSLQKPRKRLSSHSDGQIPRVRRIAENYRTNSFSGSLDGCKFKTQNVNKTITRISPKIPVMLVQNEMGSINSTNKQVVSNSRFKTPNNGDVSWVNGRHFLTATFPPDRETGNRRESIVKLLKDHSGHVQAKVSLYNSNHFSTSASNGSSFSESDSLENVKLSRASSTK